MEPLIYAGAVEMVAAGELAELRAIVVGAKANAAFLYWRREKARGKKELAHPPFRLQIVKLTRRV